MSSGAVEVITPHPSLPRQEGEPTILEPPRDRSTESTVPWPDTGRHVLSTKAPRTDALRRDDTAELGLDREHQARVSRVANCDNDEGRKSAAEIEMGLLTEEEQYLAAQRDTLGSDEYINAIHRSGWYPYQDALRNGAKLSWLLDLLLWAMLWGSIMWQLVRIYGHA